MVGRGLLQTLWLAVLVGTAIAQLNQPIDLTSLVFPGSPPEAEAVNRFVEPVPMASVRANERPRCSFNALDRNAPCVQDVDYNANIKHLVNRFINKSASVNAIFTDPMLKLILDDSDTKVLPGPVSTRFGGPTETTVCGAREELIFPQRAKTPKDDWVFVVNQDNVRQALRVERCFKDGEPCDFGIASSRDVSTVCRQKYVYRRMLTLGNNAIEPEEVLMPSCCVCYRRVDRI